MAFGPKFRMPALLYMILLIFPSTHTSHLWMACSTPRPKYRERADSAALVLPVLGLHQRLKSVYADEPLISSSVNMQKLTSAVIWDDFFKACESIGKELLNIGAIHTDDIDGWKKSKNKIVNIGIPACAFLDCFLSSIKNDSTGFLLRNNVEITSVNRPEGTVLDWLYDHMSVMKKQIKNLNLQESEELYFQKLCLYSGDVTRVESWQNGGIAPQDEIRRAKLEGISRRLQGFCLTISRLPTSRRRFDEVVKTIELSKHTEGYCVADNDIKANGSRS